MPSTSTFLTNNKSPLEVLAYLSDFDTKETLRRYCKMPGETLFPPSGSTDAAAPPPANSTSTSTTATPSASERPPRPFGAFRISELPRATAPSALRTALLLWLASHKENASDDAIPKISLAPSPIDSDSAVATVTFAVAPAALKRESERVVLRIEGREVDVSFDSHFAGLTPLYCEEPVVDIVAVPGLGSNGFGAWKAKGGPEMWLRDFLPEKVPNVRVLLYGYNADLIGPGAGSFASILDMGRALMNQLIMARERPEETRRPLVLIGHSLGGLVIKQALVDAAVAVSSPAHKDLYESFIGALFFGVPNRGLNDKFLHEIVRGQPNQYLIQSLDPESSELRRLHEGFTTIFDKTKYKFYSYYETRVTALSEINPTTGRLEETNKTAILVLQHSATECVPNQARHDHIPVDADHRGINKFATRSNHNFLQVRSHILALVSVAQEKVDRQALQKAPDFSSHDGHPVRFAVPYMENEKYTRRVKLDDMLSKLSEAEHAVVLVGPGGTGKTQAALKLAFQSRHARDVYWIDGSTIESFTSGVILVGKYLGLAKAGMKESDLCEEVKKWLESDESGKWLAVIDNLTHTDQSALDVFSAEKGTLVVTTRQEDFSRMLRARQLDYANMTAEEARMAFHNLSSIDIDDRTVDGSDIVKLLSLLDHFPLAVSLAASFIRETKTPVAEYLEMLQRSLPDYIKLSQDQTLRFELKDPPTATVIAAWDISFRRIKRDKPSAASLLQLMSMLDAHDIPVDLLHFKPTTEIGCEKGSKFDGAIAVLQSFSLVSTYKEHKYHIHDVVAAWTRKQMGDKSEHFAQLALSLIEEAISDQNSPKLVDYLPHGDAVLLHTTKFTKLVQRRMVFQSKLAGILCQAGRHSKAIELIKDCIEYYEATKKDGLENAECSYQLALIEETQKNYGEAITWHLKAKDGFVQNLGQSHLRTLGALTHLASVSELRGDYLNALQNYEQALAWAKTAPKPSDSFLIDTIHSIALVYDGQGRYPQALEFFDRALSGSIQTVGAAHPNTLAIQNNRAISLRKQGLYSDALSAFKEVAAGYAQLLGSAHPAALNVAGNIALIDDIQGRHTLALQAYTHILSQKEAHPALGEDSLSALATRANLALLQSKLARHDDAVTSARRVLEGYTATLGPDHPSTLDAVANLALILDAAGDVQAAKSHYAHACWRQAMQLGLSHPATLATLSNFAAFSARLGVWAEAVELQDQVLSGYREAFGDAHVFTLRAERELARFLGGCGRWEEALGVLERLAAGYKAERKGEGKGKSEEYEAVKREIKDVKAKMEEAVAAGGSAAWRG